MRVNLGCGQTPTPGWLNLDNSLSVRLSKLPVLPALLRSTRLVGPEQYAFIQTAREQSIRYCNVTRGLPFASDSVDVIYSSHMLEHLDREEASRFIDEAFRVLKRGGHIRLAVPDLKKLVDGYVANEDADTFMLRTHTCQARPKSLPARLRQVLVGARHHHWMYDAKSLVRLLSSRGFADVSDVAAGKTRIAAPGELDLAERADESLYVEGTKP